MHPSYLTRKAYLKGSAERHAGRARTVDGDAAGGRQVGRNGGRQAGLADLVEQVIDEEGRAPLTGFGRWRQAELQVHKREAAALVKGAAAVVQRVGGAGVGDVDAAVSGQ